MGKIFTALEKSRKKKPASKETGGGKGVDSLFPDPAPAVTASPREPDQPRKKKGHHPSGSASKKTSSAGAPPFEIFFQDDAADSADSIITEGEVQASPTLEKRYHEDPVVSKPIPKKRHPPAGTEKRTRKTGPDPRVKENDPIAILLGLDQEDTSAPSKKKPSPPKDPPFFQAPKKSTSGVSRPKIENKDPQPQKKYGPADVKPLEEKPATGPPLKTGEPDPNVITFSRPHSPEAEQFRLLKTAILFPDKGEPPRTILITSGASGEGKSFVAANLAASMASSIDEFVLLIDCDLRKPTAHKMFGLPADSPGLTEYLTGKITLEKTLYKTAVDKLTLLPCGTPPPNPSELVSSDQMRRLLQEVKTRYEDRYVILDAPPPYVTSEAAALSRQVDGIVIVVKTGSSKKSALKDLVETYGRRKILGVVKNYSDRLDQYTYKYTY